MMPLTVKCPRAKSIAYRRAATATRTGCAARRVNIRAVSTVNAAVGLAQLADRIAQAEQQLKDMFEPGKLMPKAAEVALLRKSISDMRSQLDGVYDDATPLVDPEVAAQARDAFDEVEALLSSMGSGEDMELAMLEEENSMLRAQAHQLLQRQQVLEALLHGEEA